MMFDVLVREGYNDKGKQIINVSRIHDAGLSVYLRLVQDKGGYIVSVIPLFRQKRDGAMKMDKEQVYDYGESELSKAGLSEEKLEEVRKQVDD